MFCRIQNAGKMQRLAKNHRDRIALHIYEEKLCAIFITPSSKVKCKSDAHCFVQPIQIKMLITTEQFTRNV